jgi:MoxR-like ATPase
MNTIEAITKLINNIERVIVGKRDVIQLLLVGFFSKGHVLIEDVPGVGKTMLSRALAQSINGMFKRIQFTPDLLPSDVTGISIYNQQTKDFEFKPGPVFTNILLADEINRTTPRTQSGLLESMQEFRVTVDGNIYELPKPFFVMATENPIEFRGTYPLPEAQLDRFLMRISVGYPTKSEEQDIVSRHMKEPPINNLGPVIAIEDVFEIQAKAMEILIKEEIVSYIIDLVDMTRVHPDIRLGASPRASLALMQTARSYAMINGRDYVTPDDIKVLAHPVLGHRIMLHPRSQVKGETPSRIITNILKTVSVPT